jgi:hypothetical protein
VRLKPRIGSENWSRSPHGFFGPTKTVELDGSKRCFCDRKELVELRW